MIKISWTRISAVPKEDIKRKIKWVKERREQQTLENSINIIRPGELREVEQEKLKKIIKEENDS